MGRRLKTSRAPIVVVVLVMSLFAWTDRAAAGQAQVTGSIVGRVTDESGAVLPGVTVTATSPALQIPQVIDVTDGQGDYRLTPLPIGTYRVVYTLTGFQTVRREDLRLTAGFIARVDVVLKVGAVEETVTVSGVSPTVDVQSTGSVTVLTKETLEVNPSSRSGIISIMNQSPAVRSQLDVGGSASNLAPALRVYGITTGETSWLVLEGVVATSAGGGGGGSYFDYASFEEARLQTIANDVEVPNRGINLNLIVKSGGNDFHGSAIWEQTSHALQASNLDAALAAQGITAGGALRHRFYGGGDIGGRLIRNKLWFYSGLRGRKNSEEALQVFKPDGSPGIVNQSQRMSTQKISYQMTPSQRFVGFDYFQNLLKDDPIPNNAAYETRQPNIQPQHSNKLEWQGVKGNSFVASLQVARWRFHVDHTIFEGVKPQQVDIFTTNLSGLNADAGTVVDHYRPWSTKGSIGWFRPDFFLGSHEFKAGYDDVKTTSGRGRLSLPGGDYALQFNNGVPYQFVAFNAPIRPLTTAHSTAIYGADKWVVGRRLTLNLGVRWGRDDGYVPAQCWEGGVFFESGCTDHIQAATQYSWSPRLYATYDVTGDGKTAIKGGWGRFSDWRNTLHVLPLNPNVALQRVYKWKDLNGNGNYNPGEVNLDVNGPDFVEEVGRGNVTIANVQVNPNEPQTKEDQFSLSLERELMANFGVRVTGLYSRRFDILRTENLLRGPDVYTIANTRPDPGPDAKVGTADDPGTSLTWYEYPAAYRPRAFQLNTLVADPDATEIFKTIELAGTRRFSNGWQLLASYSATHSDIPVAALTNINPNTPITATPVPGAGANRTWEWLGRASGAYVFPGQVMVSANFEHRSGDVQARTVSLSGGGTIPSISVIAEPIGSLRLPNINTIDLRVSKRFPLGGGRRVDGQIDLFNLMNANTTTARIVRSGATYLKPTAILPARIIDFVVTYSF